MKHCTHAALLATLTAAAASAQDVTVTTTTMAQVMKQDTPGFAKATYAPATEFLSLDAGNLGTSALSFHLFGWGTQDLQDATSVGGKNAGSLTYGYLQYTFDRANAEVKAGRFTVNQGVGNEQVDGISGRTDLRGGFTVSAFAGVPVIFKNLGNLPQNDISFQRDFIFGSRLGWRVSTLGELGVSYLQDGTTAAKDLPIPEPVDYTRRQLGADLNLRPWSFMTFSGRTVFDVARHPAIQGEDPSGIAEHDYSTTFKLSPTLSLTGHYVERNFYAYYAGTTLPSLFNMNEKGLFRSSGGSFTWAPFTNLQVVADLARTDRESYGGTTRAGADFRYAFPAQHLLAGVGYHKVNAFDTVMVDPAVPSFSLSHSELRAWAMVEKGAFSASLDGILFRYADSALNPSLNGKSTESQLVGTLGYQVSKACKVSGDLGLADTPLVSKQVTGLLRLDYRFGFTGKGGK